ncbi:hypothetical protein ACFL3C_02135 [Patescibacteria group bacterium]
MTKVKGALYSSFIIAIIAIMTVGQVATVYAQEIIVNTDIDFQENNLILDADDSGSDITLQFGTTLNKYLKWDNTNSYFSFNADINLEGNEIQNFNIENLAVAPTCDAAASGRMYHDTADTNSYICDGSSWQQIDSSGAAGTSLAAVQARRDTDFTLTSASTWYDIPLTLTDLESDTSVLQHNDTNNDRIDVKEDGLYRITYQINSNDASVTHQLETRVRINDTTVLDGSLLVNRNYSDEYSPSTGTFLADLTSGDYISLQAQRTTANLVIEETSVTIVKLEGIKGDQGDPGAPGTLTYTIGQFYDGTGGQNVNVTTPVAIQLDNETRKDSGITHSTVINDSRVVLDAAGWYQITYNVSTESQTTNRKNVRCRVRMNGSTYVTPSDSYMYSRNITDEWGTNTAELIVETTGTNEYYEVMCNGEGSGVGSEAANTVAGQSWTLVEKK